MMSPESASPLRLLLVDDDPGLVKSLRIILKRTRTVFEIDAVDNGQEGLRRLAQGTYHACLLDYRLGAEDGMALLRTSRERKVRTPVILLTGDRNEQLEFTALEEGAADYLNKAELDPARLEQVIARAIARRRADAALHDRERRVAEAEASALVMPAEIGLDGRWLRVSRRLSRLLGYTEEDLLRGSVQAFLHPDDLPAFEEQRRRLREAGGSPVEGERRYIRSDGEAIWMYQSCSLVSGEDGSPSYVMTHLRDVGDERRAQEALAASEQRYRSMVRRAPCGIFEATSDGRLCAANPALVAMLGAGSEAAVLALDPDSLYGGALKRQRVFERLLAAGTPGVDAVWTRADGSTVEVYISVERAPDERNILTGVVEDVTERKRIEERLRQAHKMEAIGHLAGGIAHDFNNLLTSILGYADLLKEEIGDRPAAQADLEEIHTAGRSAAALTEQLLAFSRKQLLRPEVVSVNAVIEGMRDLLERVLGDDVALVTRLGDGVSAIEADPVQIQQVLLNLAANARDAMPRGGEFLIETSARGKALPYAAAWSGEYIMMTVSDTGCGMDAETRSRMFEPFFTTKPPGKGTGLGLATVYGIVTQSGGEIFCDSAPGAGTRLSIVLPVTRRTDAAPAAAPAAGAGRGTETVLLVEDQPAVRRLTRRILETRGYRVRDTGEPEEALHLAAGGGVDLLLTDVVMPGMSGPELAARIRSQHPGMRVMFMSGFTGHSALDHTRGAPFIRKPFTPEDLVRKVRDALERSGSSRSAA